MDQILPACATLLPHVGSYRRELPVTLERLYENALDWEHLPWLHRSTFGGVEPVAHGDWGFRAWTWPRDRGPDGRFLLELKLERTSRRWISRTLEGPSAGVEIWTHATPLGERRCEVLVDFFVPAVSAEQSAKVGEFYARLYARLYDEDQWMMAERQQQLDSIRSRDESSGREDIDLGPLSRLIASLPLSIERGGRTYRIVQHNGELIAFSAVCPHLLGPLRDAAVTNGVVECPWHGYRFDIRTRACLTGANCRLAPVPSLRVTSDNRAVLQWQ